MAIPIEMLTRPADFATLQRDGSGRADRYLSVRLVRNGLGRTRFGFSTSRKLGTAVVRNRIRRRLRVIVRDATPRLERGWDILVVARPTCAEASHQELAGSIERLFARAGIVRNREGAS
jgi:ribonuclease P protein component